MKKLMKKTVEIGDVLAVIAYIAICLTIGALTASYMCK